MKIDHSKYNLSNDFIDEIVKSSAGFLTTEEFDKILELFESETGKYNFTRSGESNLLRVISSLYDKRTFLIDALNYPHYIEIITAIAFNSNYLSDIIVRNPEYLYQTFNNEYLNQAVTSEKLEVEIQSGISKFKTFNSKLNFLKALKRRYILKIGLLDILFELDIKSVTQALSLLAKTISANLFELCLKEVIEKYKINYESEYCLIALGKLGGDELNYSSDIDLIVFYDKNEYSENSTKDFQEILSETIHLFVQSSTNITEKGFLYRVDFRLRPDGRNSPLTSSLTDYLRYYETRGEDWERQMLIKQSLCGGSKKLYEQFDEFIQGFIYAPLLINSVAAKIKNMKDNIELQSNTNMNVKTFAGGIRDIEFSVQALQLIYGSKVKGIRSSNTLKALHLLQNNKLINSDEKSVFTEAYSFFRKIEHFLQLQNDIQTHTIPSDENTLNSLSKYLGMTDANQFHSKLETHRQKVREIYLSIVNVEEETPNREDDTLNIEFENKKTAEKNLLYLSKGIGLLGQKEFDSRTIEIFEEIKPSLLSHLKSEVDPDKTLDNFTKIISQAQIKSIWYSELKKPQFMKAVLNICSFSQRAVDLLIQNKKFLDLLLSQQIFRNDNFTVENVTDIKNLQLILACSYANKLLDLKNISKLSAEWVVKRIQSKIGNYNFDENYFLAGLGSLGTASMGFGSDIDLIVISERIDENGELQNSFQRILDDFRKEFYPIPVDFRLRPEGKSSQLVWDIEGYREYLKNRILPWEIQSLTKIKFISGDKKLFDNFIEVVTRRLEKFQPGPLLHNVQSIYKKYHSENISGFSRQINLKKVKGGLFDIDYTLQYLIISKPEIFKYCLGKDVETKGEILKNHYFCGDEITELIENFKFLKNIDISIQNIFGINSSNLPMDEKKQKLIADFLGIKFDKFNSLIISKLTADQKIIEKFLEIK